MKRLIPNITQQPNKTYSNKQHIQTLHTKLVNIDDLKSANNLFGFSGGSDSVALFFMLDSLGVLFDICIVDYKIRAQSQKEVMYAKKLAKTYNKQCFVMQAPRFRNNFELRAREFRYECFEKLILANNYKNLILAHHFNDRLEWLFMQLLKGSGLSNLLGFKPLESRESYNIIRPMSWIKKAEILAFCEHNKLIFFNDETNANTSFLRNNIRINVANFLSEHSLGGLEQSFNILSNEREWLYDCNISNIGGIYYGFFSKQTIVEGFRAHYNAKCLHIIDVCLKKMGYVLSSKQREEIIKHSFSCEIGGGRADAKNPRFIIERIEKLNHTYIIIAKRPAIIPKMPKDFKNMARSNGVAPRLRAVLFDIKDKADFTILLNIFSNKAQ